MPNQTASARIPRAAYLVGLAFLLFWPIYQLLSQFVIDNYGDMFETFAWGIGWQWGYVKHPPLMGWIAAGWFELLPRSDFFFYLLASANVTATILIMAAIGTRFLSPRQVTIAVLTAQALPPLTAIGHNYNANSAMLPFWALSLLFYLRVLERRRVVDALLLGLSLGLSMLAKYESAALVLALAIHALADREARRLLATPLPWIAAALALAVFAPHVVWLFRNDFAPIVYAANQGGAGVSVLMFYVVEFVLAFFAYMLPGLVVLAFYRSPRDGGPLLDWQAMRALLHSSAGRALLAAAFLPMVLTVLLSLAAAADLSTPWQVPFFFCIPILLTILLPRRVAERNGGRTPFIAAAMMGLLLAAAPFVKAETIRLHPIGAAIPYRGFAMEVQRVWRENTDAPLKIVIGPRQFSFATAFYSGDEPYASEDLSDTPWITAAMIADDGAIYACGQEDTACCQRAAEVLGKVDSEQTVEAVGPAPGGNSRTWGARLCLRMPRR